MQLEKENAARELEHWQIYLAEYRLPDWDTIPDLGLYMEQILVLLQQYLDYFPKEIKDEPLITAAAINNYVRKKLMPEPVKKRYYRSHIACLIMICSLKQSLSISLLQLLLPHGQSEEEVKTRYESFARQQRRATDAFLAGTREQKGNLTEKKGSSPAEDPEAFIFSAATVSAFSRLLAERLILLKQDADGEKEVP